MTQEEKQLVFKDLCARLPYGVVVERTYIPENNGYTSKLSANTLDFVLEDNWLIKPYLRPMSSMTEEEYKEFSKISGLYKKEEGNYFSNHLSELGNSIITERVMVRTIDWLNSHYFDYRGLIPMELALEAKEGIYKNK